MLASIRGRTIAAATTVLSPGEAAGGEDQDETGHRRRIPAVGGLGVESVQHEVPRDAEQRRHPSEVMVRFKWIRGQARDPGHDGGVRGLQWNAEIRITTTKKDG